MTPDPDVTDATPTGDTPTFGELGLPEPLTRATDELGFTRCTEIQALTLPHIVAGRDVAAQAQTGTGKTAAFLLGSFARLLASDGRDGRRADQPRMLVIAPTRELAMQIKKDADALGAHTGLTNTVVYGGIDYEKQRDTLAVGVDVLIGTPGRLIDYFKQRVYDLSALEFVVLDEADRMFDLGFIADIRYLLRRMPPPPERNSMLFSATLSHRVMELAYEHMNDPVELKTHTDRVTADKVIQSLYHPASDEKIPLLLGLLRDLEPPRAMIFVNTKRAAERIENYLVGNDVVCGLLSGDVRQNKRQKILADFTAGKIPVLIATDVAARGLHIDDVTHVFNYDLPQQAEDYVHRIGRTARAGTDGVAVSFACENYSFSLPEIQDYIGQSIPLEPITDELLVKPKRPARIERDRVERPGERGRGGRPGGGRGDGRGGGAREGGREGGRARGRSASRRDANGARTADATPTEAPGSDIASAGTAAPPATNAAGAGAAADADAGGRRDGRRGRRGGRRRARGSNEGASDGAAADGAVNDATTASEPSGNAHADGAADAADNGAPKKKRRRRRRGRRATAGAAAPTPESPAGDGDASGESD